MRGFQKLQNPNMVIPSKTIRFPFPTSDKDKY